MINLMFSFLVIKRNGFVYHLYIYIYIPNRSCYLYRYFKAVPSQVLIKTGSFVCIMMFWLQKKACETKELDQMHQC